MLDLGWPELFIIMLVALLIVGYWSYQGLCTAASWLRKQSGPLIIFKIDRRNCERSRVRKCKKRWRTAY